MAWRMYDFKCVDDSCATVFEDLIQPDDKPTCPACGAATTKLPSLTRSFSTIQASTRTSRVHTAGGVHKKTEKSGKIWVPVNKG